VTNKMKTVGNSGFWQSAARLSA